MTEAVAQSKEQSWLDRLSPMQLRVLGFAAIGGVLVLGIHAVHDETTQMMDVVGPPAVEQVAPEIPLMPALTGGQLVDSQL